MHLEERKRMDSLSIYIKFFNADKTSILDFSNPYDLIIVDPYKMKLNEETTYSDLITYSDNMAGHAFIDLDFKLKLDSILQKRHLAFEVYAPTDQVSIDLGILDIEPFAAHLEQLSIFINEYHDYQILLAVKQKVSFERIKDFLQTYKINYSLKDFNQSNVVIINEDLPGSFIDNPTH